MPALQAEVARSFRPALALDAARCLARSTPASSSSNRWAAIQALRARRHRRQYADDAGPRPARRARAGTTFASTARPAHGGGNIHWSRLVDLPIAGLKLLFTPLVGGADAERIAVAVAPLLPMLVLMSALALTMRRLVEPTRLGRCRHRPALRRFGQRHVAPLRIDHHGWQLAMLASAVAWLADPQTRARRRDARASPPACRWRSAWRC